MEDLGFCPERSAAMRLRYFNEVMLSMTKLLLADGKGAVCHFSYGNGVRRCGAAG